MAIEVFNRNEIKYKIDSNTYEAIRNHLAPYMEADAYSQNGDCYLISNIYYDTPDNELIRRSLDKPVYKEKLRLRSYGKAELNQKVFLEIKKKYQGIVNKRRTRIVLSDAYRFIDNKVYTNTNGSSVIPDYMNKQVVNELTYMLNQYNTLQPALYLSYERCAMFSKTDHDLRITFDRNITTRRYDLGLHYGNYGELLLPEGEWVMEVKAGESMPIWLTSILTEYKVFPESFSKYGTEYKAYTEKKQEVVQCLIHLSAPQMGQYQLEHH